MSSRIRILECCIENMRKINDELNVVVAGNLAKKWKRLRIVKLRFDYYIAVFNRVIKESA